VFPVSFGGGALVREVFESSGDFAEGQADILGFADDRERLDLKLTLSITIFTLVNFYVCKVRIKMSELVVNGRSWKESLSGSVGIRIGILCFGTWLHAANSMLAATTVRRQTNLDRWRPDIRDSSAHQI